MNIPESTNSAAPLFTLQAGRELLTALQAQDVAGNFKQALETTNSIADTLEILPTSQVLNADPTTSALFQAHSGSFASSQASAALADHALSAEGIAPLKVTGISAAAATGPFANGQSSPPDDFQLELPVVEPAQATRYPAAAGADGDRGTYGAMMNHQIGARLDLKG